MVNPFLELLFGEIKNRRCFLFIGAGFSLNADLPDGVKMPTWDELGKSLSKDLQEKSDNPLQIASIYEKEINKTILIKKMTELLHVGNSSPGPIHKKLTTIKEFDTIVTTNFDFLLEQAYFSEGKHVNVIVGDKNISKYSPSTESNIIKIHGDFSNYPEIVVTQEDYDNFNKEHSVLALNVASWFTTKIPLFIGYGLNDPHFLEIRKRLKKSLGKFLNPWFIVKFDATQDEIEDGRKEDLIIINLETKNKTREKALSEFLCQIQDYVNVKNMDAFEFPSEEQTTDETKKISKDQFTGNILRSFSNLEVKLRNTLEKFGYDKTELRKPFSFLIKSALSTGILTIIDIGDLSNITKIRNNVAHTAIVPTIKEVEYVESITSEIIKKLSVVNTTSIQPVKIELFTDKFSYKNGETIFLKGNISKILSDTTAFSLIVTGLDGHIIGIDQVDVSKGEFKSTFTVGGPLWTKSGEYVITARYGLESNKKKISINYEKTDKIELTSQLELEVNEKIFSISHLIQGGAIVGLFSTIGTNVLTVKIETFADGKLWIKIPRHYLDAKKGSNDDKFFVLCDGEEVEIIEKPELHQRELIIPFVKGTHEVMIVGTSIIGGEKSKKDLNTVEILVGSSAPRGDEKYLKPQSMIIKKGETVTWDNCDSAAHTITSGIPEGGADGNFDSNLFMSGNKFSHTFKKKGTYRYFCMIHPWKEGKIIVID